MGIFLKEGNVHYHIELESKDAVLTELYAV